jgi:hypothetical protein
MVVINSLIMIILVEKVRESRFCWSASSHLHVVPAPAVETLGVLVSLINGGAVEDDDDDLSVHDAIDGAETWPSSGCDACLGANALPELVEVLVRVLPLHFPEL